MSRCGIQYLFMELDEEDDMVSSEVRSRDSRDAWVELHAATRSLPTFFNSSSSVLEKIREGSPGYLWTLLFHFRHISGHGCLLGKVTRQRTRLEGGSRSLGTAETPAAAECTLTAPQYDNNKHLVVFFCKLLSSPSPDIRTCWTCRRTWADGESKRTSNPCRVGAVSLARSPH